MGIGETAALAAAALWAVSSLLYAKTRLTAWGMNLAKMVIATAIVLVQLLIVAAVNGTSAFTASPEAWGWLTISGLIGLTIGDTCYFRSLQILGARKCLIVTTTAPVFAALLGWLVLEEVLLMVSVVGIGVTLLGIIAVVSERSRHQESPGLYPGSQKMGVVLGLAASVCQALGALASKIGMADCGPLEGSLLRMLTGSLLTLVVVCWRKELRTTTQAVLRKDVMKSLLPATVCGTWLGIWFSMIAIEETSIGIAQTLMSTSPLFVIPLVRVLYGHTISMRAAVASVVAVSGIVLIMQPRFGIDRAQQPKQTETHQAAREISRKVTPTERRPQQQPPDTRRTNSFEPMRVKQLGELDQTGPRQNADHDRHNRPATRRHDEHNQAKEQHISHAGRAAIVDKVLARTAVVFGSQPECDDDRDQQQRPSASATGGSLVHV